MENLASPEKKGYDKLVDPTGSPPLSALMDADARNNPSRVFVRLSDRPRGFMLKSQMYNIRPGKKVRILEHFHDIVDDFTHITEVYATKDSIGILLSYEEYEEHSTHENNLTLDQRSLHDDHLRQILQDAHLRHLEWVKSAMRTRTYYPVRFEKFVPLPEKDYAKLKQEYAIVDIVCEVGAIIVLPIKVFVVI